MNLTKLSEKYNTQEKCIAKIEEIRWQGKPPCCDFCGSTHLTRRKKKPLLLHCNTCNKDTSIIAGTIFEETRMPLPKWFQLIHLMLNAKSGISAAQISRTIGVTYKTAWYSAMRVRCAMLDWGEMLEGIVEMDESYFGGKPRYRYKKNQSIANISKVYQDFPKNKRGRGTKKVPIAGIVERKGRVVAKVMDRLTSENLIALLKKAVKTKESTLMTDDFSAYNKMDEIIERFVIQHYQKEYVRGAVHTNSIEGFWSIIKNGIKGQYKVLSRKYLPFYLAEYTYRYNRRQLDVSDSFKEALNNAVVNEKCFTDYKPKKDVKQIAYPRRKKKAVKVKCAA